MADGLTLFGGALLAVVGADVSDTAVLVAARRSKERTYPELMGPRARARLVVLAEVGGRWSHEVSTFVQGQSDV